MAERKRLRKLEQRRLDDDARGRQPTPEHDRSWAEAVARRDASGYVVRVFRYA
jgi:hypothetical protein